MPVPVAELEPLLRLALVQGVGPGRLARLLGVFGSAERVLSSSPAELMSIHGIGDAIASRIRDATSEKARDQSARALERLTRLGVVVLLPGDPLYPTSFHNVPEPPYLLFCAGRISSLKETGIAVVGTRAPSHYGRRAARRLAADLAAAGYAIVSGMARGIDSAAHLGALDVGGTTIGVLGHGIEQAYPPENREIFARVVERGLLITEYPPGETPKAGNFPRRNRLIAALSEAVLVVEMGHRSGAQHTVNYGLELGKEVLAVPGPIGTATSAGTNQLIRDGATLTTCATDVLEALHGVGTTRAASAERVRARVGSADGRTGNDADSGGGSLMARVSATDPMLFTDLERRLLDVLSFEPLQIDDLARQVGIDVSGALTLLLQLEIRGFVQALPGKRYVLA